LRRAQPERLRDALSDAIHRALQHALALPADKRFHRFLQLSYKVET